MHPIKKARPPLFHRSKARPWLGAVLPCRSQDSWRFPHRRSPRPRDPCRHAGIGSP